MKLNVDGQLTIQDFLSQPFKIKTPVRLIELFGGVGSQAMALKELGVNFEHYRLVEFDKFPVASYNAIHGTDFEPLDIRKLKGQDLGIVETEKYTYFMTYSFPCQDLSVAGKQKGMTKGSNTRSGLLWEVERLLNETENLPQVLLMENVPQVHSKKNMPDFQMWLDFLKSKGYQSFYQDLNAKDYNVAQNRVRCICVSILGNKTYSFPISLPLEKQIEDYLEEKVDKKYYLKGKKVKKLVNEFISTGKILRNRQMIDLSINSPQILSCANCISARTDRGISNRRAEGSGILEVYMCRKDYAYSTNGTNVSGTIRASYYKNGERNIIENIKNHKGYEGIIEIKEKKIDDKILDECTFEYEDKDCIYHIRVRKLTPRECWRLMGFTDRDFNMAQEVNSNTQLYKQAGNSIVKNVLVAVMGQLFEGKENIYSLNLNLTK